VFEGGAGQEYRGLRVLWVVGQTAIVFPFCCR